MAILIFSAVCTAGIVVFMPRFIGLYEDTKKSWVYFGHFLRPHREKNELRVLSLVPECVVVKHVSHRLEPDTSAVIAGDEESVISA